MSTNLNEIGQITILQRKLKLLEGEKNAFAESSRAIMQKNTESIQRLKQNNSMLYRKLAGAKAGHAHIIKAVFQDRGTEKEAYRNMTLKEAITALDQSVQTKKKRLNAMKHITQTLERQWDELQKEYQRRKRVCSEAPSTDTRARKHEEDEMTIRDLENHLEKTQLKCKQAENITATYLTLKRQMQEESVTYKGQLDSLEADLQKHREELSNVKAMYKNAQLTKNAAKAELQQQEKRLYKNHKEREQVIASYRKVEKNKIQTVSIEPNDLSRELHRSITRMSEEEDEHSSAYEEAYRRLKEITGVTSIQELEEQFTSQQEAGEHLEKIKSENEKILLELKEQELQLNKEFQEMKNSGEGKSLSMQQVQEERKQLLKSVQLRYDTARGRVEHLVKTVNAVRAAVEHLADKLQHITLSEEDAVSQESPESGEDVVELLKQCQLKIKLMEKELKGNDLSPIMKEIKEDEFHAKVEEKLPSHSVHVKLPEDPRVDQDEHGAAIEDKEVDLISREELKRQSQLIAESHIKKKAWKMRKGEI
ncbi:coiled-coil domain-containing protein 151 [Thalassophryne amazonica]|uniref:coiled-coil domain-containing protein 151 n=1 Tax=Thalassophryne amazonica TaxID=390379 RepID=UPI001470D306|nr:coiled-coil domain-containing protein 151 [Thalassophryne amazonica]